MSHAVKYKSFSIELFTISVYSGASRFGILFPMPDKRKKQKPMKASSALRASVSFPPAIYRTLEQIAKQKKVSIAWVVRDATEKYIDDQWPLFKKNHE